MYSNFPDKIADLCYKKFKSLGKKGKPQADKEWTLLAAIVMSTDLLTHELKVVSLCTGTKCCGFSELSDKGDTLFDSHAEVLVRRCFIKFLMHHIKIILNKKDSSVFIFDNTEEKFNLKPNVKFHLFVSHVPCGDAAIFPKSVYMEEQRSSDGESCPKKVKYESEYDINQQPSESESPSSDLVEDIHRTGAKCVPEGDQDPRLPGPNFHVTGVLRTKPGRGDPTWSMSCSDKMAVWNVCGLQGALLSNMLAEPIYVSSLIFGKCPYDESAVHRAVIDRLSSVKSLPQNYRLNRPTIQQSSLIFEFSKEKIGNIDAVPCSSSLIWCDVPGFHEVSVNGKRQGVTKKNIDKPSARTGICKIKLLESFLEIVVSLPRFAKKEMVTTEELTYLDYKKMATTYRAAKSAVFQIFDKWKRKPERLQRFSIDVK